MQAQRNGIHITSRRASSARRNPPALDSCEPASHNASPGDITESTPPGAQGIEEPPPRDRGHDQDFPGARGVLRARAGRVPTHHLPDSSGGAGSSGPGGCPAMEPYRSEPSLDTRIIMNSMNTQNPFAALTSQMRMYAPLRSGGLA